MKLIAMDEREDMDLSMQKAVGALGILGEIFSQRLLAKQVQTSSANYLSGSLKPLRGGSNPYKTLEGKSRAVW